MSTFLFGGSNFAFLKLGEAMVEVTSCDDMFEGKSNEVPKSHTVAFTLGAPKTPHLYFAHKFSAIFFCIRIK